LEILGYYTLTDISSPHHNGVNAELSLQVTQTMFYGGKGTLIKLVLKVLRRTQSCYTRMDGFKSRVVLGQKIGGL